MTTTEPRTPIDTPPAVRDDSVDHAADVEAIERIIQDTETAFNTNDADLLVEHLAADVVTVGVTGATLRGRDEIIETSRTLFAGPLHDQFARYDIDEIRFLRPDVAVAHKRALATDAQGTPIELDHAMTAAYVLTKEHGRWWVVARQNTLIARGPGAAGQPNGERRASVDVTGQQRPDVTRAPGPAGARRPRGAVDRRQPIPMTTAVTGRGWPSA